MDQDRLCLSRRPGHAQQTGIDRTDWIRIDGAAYDQCLDPLDYRGGQVRRR